MEKITEINAVIFNYLLMTLEKLGLDADRRNFNEIDFNDEHYNESCISAPTQSLVQKWLRDKHNIIVNVNYDFAYTHNWGCEIWKNDILDNNKGIRDSYEDALEYGLDCALSNLI